jgi:2-keto-4-pentenoate hydratase
MPTTRTNRIGSATAPPWTGAIREQCQGQTIQTLVRGGRRVVGAKIGLTAPAVQRQFGVRQPDFGMILDDTVLGHGETVPIDKLMRGVYPPPAYPPV